MRLTLRRSRDDLHTLAGAYALDSLEPAEQAAFERHLHTCEPCRQEADGLREAVTRLGVAASAAPPPGLRDRVLAQASRTRQLRPFPWEVAGRTTGGSSAWPVVPRFAVALAGLAILVALGLGGFVVHAQLRLGQDAARSSQVAAVLNAPDATMTRARPSGGGTATLVMSHRMRAVVLTTARLRPLPGSERYEVWLMGPTGERSAGMLPVPRHGMTSPMVVSGIRAGDRIGVTMEPASGASRPTLPMVLMVGLPA